MAKRAIDLIVAAAGLLVLSPLLATLSLLVKLSSPGPVFYRGSRIGQHGRPFHIFKFRTMFVDAKRRPAITAAEDDRITRIGRWLRRTKLDELPQLLNVLRGEMSLVGPRPEDPRYVGLYTPEQRRILEARPGITSAASLVFRGEEELLAGEEWEATYRDRIMPQKIALDLTYLENATVLSDLGLILRTLSAIVRWS